MVGPLILLLFGNMVSVLTTNHITTKLTYQNQDQRQMKYHHLTTTLHLTLKITTTQVDETSVTNSSLSKDYDYAKEVTGVVIALSTGSWENSH